jgi:hypothetical protein
VQRYNKRRKPNNQKLKDIFLGSLTAGTDQARQQPYNDIVCFVGGPSHTHQKDGPGCVHMCRAGNSGHIHTRRTCGLRRVHTLEVGNSGHIHTHWTSGLGNTHTHWTSGLGNIHTHSRERTYTLD